MTRMKARFRKAAGIAATASALVLAGCLGGTGTDTENGILVSARVVTADGTPAANVSLTVFEAHTWADSPLTSPVVGPDSSDAFLTNSEGYVTFLLKQSGTYVAKGSVKDTVLFLDTLRAKIDRNGVIGGGVGSPLFHTEEPKRAKGKMRLLSGYSPDSGRVALQGTNLQWTLGADGEFDLGWLPPSAEKMTLRVSYWASPSDSSASAECVKPGNGGGNGAKLRLEEGEIVVDDLHKKAGCPVGQLP
jgi:hypothetical protein